MHHLYESLRPPRSHLSPPHFHIFLPLPDDTPISNTWRSYYTNRSQST